MVIIYDNFEIRVRNTYVSRVRKSAGPGGDTIVNQFGIPLPSCKTFDTQSTIHSIERGQHHSRYGGDLGGGLYELLLRTLSRVCMSHPEKLQSK